jgi:hypothetical protein
MRVARPEQNTVGYDDGGTSAGLEQPQKQLWKKQLGRPAPQLV